METTGIQNSFDQLAKINWASNQMFFMRGFSHALVTPINTIMLGSQLLSSFLEDITGQLDEFYDEGDCLTGGFCEAGSHILSNVPQVIQNINSAALRLHQYAAHLSEFNSSGVIAASNHADINQLAPLCVSMIQHKIHEHTKQFSLDIENNLPLLSGNAQQIAQLISSLLMNALLSLPDRSCSVSFSATCNYDAGQIQLRVADQGVGIPQENLTRVIEPFFTTWQKHGCIGLGLTVADQIVKKMVANCA